MTSLAPTTKSIASAAPAASSGDRGIAFWLLCCAALIFLMVVIGGVTRLTESGLSITQWQPIAGAIPPLSESDWALEFERYKAIPQYQAIHAGMTLAEFKTIFLWEYVHRLWGRLIGVAFGAPFLWFLWKRRIPVTLVPKLAGLFVLGGLQGALGWFMVESGLLPDRIEVSQYRLTAHLALAVVLYLAIVWVALGLWPTLTLPLLRSGSLPLPPKRGRGASARLTSPSPTKWETEGPSAERWEGEGPPSILRRALSALLALAFLTMVAGGFVAGLRAGYVYNTFPLMNGYIIPPDYATVTPWYLNPFESLAAAQFDHRVLAELTWAAAMGLWLWSLRLRLKPALRWAFAAISAVATLQFGLGIGTLLLVVPIPLAAAHQGGALLLLTAILVARHAVRRPEIDGSARAAL